MGLSAPGTGVGALTESSFTTQNQGSISLWVRPQALSGVQRLMGGADQFEGRFDGTTLYDDWFIGGGGGQNFGTFSVGTLYHCVGTWDLTTEVGQTYRDGSFVASGSGYNDTFTGVVSMFSRVGTNPFNGDLHDIRIYNRVLSASEILTIYNSRGKDSIVYGLVDRWTCDEGVNGSTLSGSGTVKDRGASQIDFDADTGAPTYIYDADVTPRRR